MLIACLRLPNRLSSQDSSFLINADGPITLEDRVLDGEDRGDLLGPGGSHDVLGIHAHSAHHLCLPISVLDEYQRRPIDDGAETGRALFQPCHQAMHQSNC